MTKARKLRELLARREFFIAPGAYDAMTARLVEQAGFPAVKLLGNATTASLLGLPDLGFLSLMEVVNHARNVAAAVEIPLMVDADTGFLSGPLGIIRTVREFERAGLAGFSFEDQAWPKKCALIEGATRVVPIDEHTKRIEAAVHAREDKDFVIGARTDAEESLGLDEAIKRANAYADAGADVISIALRWSREKGRREQTIQALRRIGREVKAPVSLMFSDEVIGAGNATIEEIRELGFAVGSCNSIRYTVVKSVADMLQVLKRDWSTVKYGDRMASLKEYNQLLGLQDYMELEARFTAK
jgi:2-methylisocitrate lyase-like PEP mutase family enzyme